MSNVFALDSKYYISNIEFVGNESFSSLELHDVIRLKNPGLLTKSIFTSKILNLDKITLEAFYRASGFINVKVNPNVSKTSENNVTIEFIVNEGKRFYLESIEIVGNKTLTQHDINKYLDSQRESVYNPVKISQDLKTLKYYYMTLGKKNISIIDETEITDNKVNLRITIAEGPSFFINSIKINGISSVKEKFIEREILFNVNEPYNIQKIDETKNNIFEIGLFSFVEIHSIKNKNNNRYIDIVIDLRELKSRGIFAEVGFDQVPSTIDGNLPVSIFNSSLDWQIGNIFKTTTKLGFGFELGLKANDIEQFNLFRKYTHIKLSSPWIWKYRAPVTNKLYFEDLNDVTHVISYGLISSITYRKSKYSHLLFNFNLNFISATNDIIEDRNISVTYLNQKIQNPMFPEQGHSLSITPTFHGSFLGGNRNYIQFDFEYRRYFEVLKPVILAFRTNYNTIYTFDVENEATDLSLSHYELFHLGGESTLRGWSSIEEFYTQDSTLDNIGSKIRCLSNFELRFPMFWKIGGEIFYDGGFLTNTLKDEIKWYWNIGYGLTFRTPLGPARFDIAYPFADKNQGNFTLSMAYMF